SAGIVEINRQTGTQRAVKRMRLGINHDADMPRPDDEVAGLRRFYARKLGEARVEIRRRRIGIIQSGELVHVMYQMRAVGLVIEFAAMFPGGADNCGTLAAGDHLWAAGVEVAARARDHTAAVRRSRRLRSHK